MKTKLLDHTFDHVEIVDGFLTIESLLGIHQAISEECRDIMRVKNHDYTSGSKDPFANFRMSETIGIPAELAILIRSMDKFQRIRTFVEKGTLRVENEGVDDAIMDVINYMVILYGMVTEKRLKGISSNAA